MKEPGQADMNVDQEAGQEQGPPRKVRSVSMDEDLDETGNLEGLSRAQSDSHR